jgi:general secretion pathway protein G
MHPSRHSKSAFTLLEVLLVVAILGIIAAFAVMQMDIGGTQTRAKRDTARLQVMQVKNAVNVFRLHTNRLPTTLEQLKTNPGIEGWSGPYHQRFNDPFGDPLVYTVSGQSFEIRSNAGGSEGGPISSNDD